MYVPAYKALYVELFLSQFQKKTQSGRQAPPLKNIFVNAQLLVPESKT